jgi:hypothetical protein
MAPRVIKLREPSEPAQAEPEERTSQSKKPEAGRYLLQVDRQTKASYSSAETAEAVGLAIKKAHPVVQVSIYDSVEYERRSWNCPPPRNRPAIQRPVRPTPTAKDCL